MFKTFGKFFSLINPARDARAGAEVIRDIVKSTVNTTAERTPLEDVAEADRIERASALRREAASLILTIFVAATLSVWSGVSMHSVAPMIIGGLLVIGGSVGTLMKFWAASMIQKGRPITLSAYIRSLFTGSED